jgi:hypothetical protein
MGMSAPSAKHAGGPLSRGAKALSAFGVIAALVVAVNANVLVARFYTRWDVTSEGLYTLSAATKSILAELAEPVTVTVLLGRTDPLLGPLRQLLTAYRAESSQLDVRYLDPEQNPAEFAAIQQKYGVAAGKAEDGRLVTDAVIVIARSDRVWFVTADELSAFDEEGRAKPRLEQALSEGVASLFAGEKAKICFASGRGEASLDDVSPEGLSELRRRLEKSNFEVEPIDVTEPGSEKALKACRLLAVVGPEAPYGVDAAERVRSFVAGGGSALLLLGPLIGDDGLIAESGLERVTELAGVRVERTLVLETDAGRRLPRGAGEVFLATPVEHALTRGLVLEGGKVELRAVVSESRSLLLSPAAPAQPLLKSSDQAITLSDVKRVLEPALPADAPQAERVLAAAAELPKPQGSTAKYGPRLVIAGSSGFARSQSFRDPALVGNRLLVENALAWAAVRPAIVNVPEKPARAVGLALTEESLSEVLRYVLIYMPAAAALIGGLILYRRRAEEKNSRRQSDEGAGA